MYQVQACDLRENLREQNRDNLFCARFSLGPGRGGNPGRDLFGMEDEPNLSRSCRALSCCLFTGTTLGVRCPAVKRIRRVGRDEHVNHLAGRRMAQERGAKLDTVGQVDLDAAVLRRRRRDRDRAASLPSRAAPRSQGAEGSPGGKD